MRLLRIARCFLEEFGRDIARVAVMFACLMIAAGCVAACIGLIYTAGQVNGLNKGYALGMKVADAYRQRAEECEGK